MSGEASSHPPLPSHKPRVVSLAAGTALTEKRCVPCEADKGALSYMGMCLTLDRPAAQRMLSEIPGWELFEDAEQRLHLRRQWRTKTFVKALELCERIGEVAETEGHHPDLHVTGWNKPAVELWTHARVELPCQQGWNKLAVELWTHARDGLTDNDFIMAAKINEIPKEDLLRKPKKKLAEE
ncbi:hypothetical protein WJX72_006206 [[Myrmecia] bisecta]|uniref:4a-hydroxytetrahydrobiopterin dehydratase n=1 Tax=[Myrmecia] bisecta TaxID=41462 RepID=A0AAW1PB52_9CHLO